MSLQDPKYRLSYLDGWEDCQKAIITHINEVSKYWLNNGPSKATADLLIKHIKKMESKE